MTNLKNAITIVAATSREVLRQVRERLGPDAIILSNRVTAAGVEIVAVADRDYDDTVQYYSTGLGADEQPRQQGYDEPQDDHAGSAALTYSAAPLRKPHYPAAPALDEHGQGSNGVRNDQPEQPEQRFRTPSVAFRAFADEPAAVQTGHQAESMTRTIASAERASHARATTEKLARNAIEVPPPPPVTWRASASVIPSAVSSEVGQDVVSEHLPATVSGSPLLLRPQLNEHELLREIHSMRGRLEEQIASLSWGKKEEQDPLRSHLMHLLLGAGFSSGLSRALIERLPENTTIESATQWMRQELAKKIPVAVDENAMLDAGGIYALVGPTGVGKTTTTAKLAARCVLRFGAENLALVTTDSYRIGAFEQLRIYGQILGVGVYSVKDTDELNLVLDDLRDKHMILIDTVGKSQRDNTVADQIAMLCGTGRSVRRLLLLNATSHGDTLNEVVQRYRQPEYGDLSGCIFTKVDESTHPGALIDTAIRHRLPVHYISTGQRVPENLLTADKQMLVDLAFDARSDSSLFVPAEADLIDKSVFQREQEATEALKAAQQQSEEQSLVAGRLRIQCAKLIGMLAKDADQLGRQSDQLLKNLPCFTAVQHPWASRNDPDMTPQMLARTLSSHARQLTSSRDCVLAIAGRATLAAEESGDAYTLHSTLLVDGNSLMPLAAPVWSLSTAGGVNPRQTAAKNLLHMEKNRVGLSVAKLSCPVIYLLEQLPGGTLMQRYAHVGGSWIARARPNQSVHVADSDERKSMTLTRLADTLDFGHSRKSSVRNRAVVSRLAQQWVTLRYPVEQSGSAQADRLLCIIERTFDAASDEMLSQQFILTSANVSHFSIAKLTDWYASRSEMEPYFKLQKKVMQQLGGCGEPGDIGMMRRFPLMLQLSLTATCLAGRKEKWATEVIAYLERLSGAPARSKKETAVSPAVLAEGLERMFGLLEALREEHRDLDGATLAGVELQGVSAAAEDRSAASHGRAVGLGPAAGAVSSHTLMEGQQS